MRERIGYGQLFAFEESIELFVVTNIISLDGNLGQIFGVVMFICKTVTAVGPKDKLIGLRSDQLQISESSSAPIHSNNLLITILSTIAIHLQDTAIHLRTVTGSTRLNRFLRNGYCQRGIRSQRRPFLFLT